MTGAAYLLHRATSPFRGLVRRRPNHQSENGQESLNPEHDIIHHAPGGHPPYREVHHGSPQFSRPTQVANERSLSNDRSGWNVRLQQSFNPLRSRVSASTTSDRNLGSSRQSSSRRVINGSGGARASSTGRIGRHEHIRRAAPTPPRSRNARRAMGFDDSILNPGNISGFRLGMSARQKEQQHSQRQRDRPSLAASRGVSSARIGRVAGSRGQPYAPPPRRGPGIGSERILSTRTNAKGRVHGKMADDKHDDKVLMKRTVTNYSVEQHSTRPGAYRVKTSGEEFVRQRGDKMATTRPTAAHRSKAIVSGVQDIHPEAKSGPISSALLKSLKKADQNSHRSSTISNRSLARSEASASKIQEVQVAEIHRESLRKAHDIPTTTAAIVHDEGDDVLNMDNERSFPTSTRTCSASPHESFKTNRSSSNSTNLSSTISEASASKIREGQLETVRQQSLRSAYNMPTATATLQVVHEVSSADVSRKSIGNTSNEDVQATAMFNWSKSSLGPVQGIVTDDHNIMADDTTAAMEVELNQGRLSGKDQSSESSAVLAKLLVPEREIHKRSSVQSLFTNTSYATAPAHNLTEVDKVVESEERTQETVTTKAEHQVAASNGIREMPQQSSIFPGDRDYLVFLAKAGSGNRLVEDEAPTRAHIPPPVRVTRSTSGTSSGAISASSASTEFRRFRNEAAEFGRLHNSATAIAEHTTLGDVDVDVCNGDSEAQTSSADEPENSDVRPPSHPKARCTSLFIQGKEVDKPLQGQQRQIPHQEVKQRPRVAPIYPRDTDTSCTIANTDDSMFPQIDSASLDSHFAKTRPPTFVKTETMSGRSGSNSSVSSLSTRPKAKALAPPYTKHGRFSRALRRKKKDKDKRNENGLPNGLPSQEVEAKDADTPGGKERLTNVLSERLANALNGSISSVASSRRTHEEADHSDDCLDEKEISSSADRKPSQNASALINHTSTSSDLSAEVEKGDEMISRWKKVGIDIATKQLDAAQAYYAKGDFERARRCCAQVAEMDQSMEGGDDVTVVFKGLVDEARTMLVRIDGAQLLSEGNEGEEIDHDEYNAATQPSFSSLPIKEGASSSHSGSKDLFAAVCNTFFFTNDGEGKARLEVETDDVKKDAGSGVAEGAGSDIAADNSDGSFDDFVDGFSRQQNLDGASIIDVANDVVSRRSTRSAQSSIASIGIKDNILEDPISDVNDHDLPSRVSKEIPAATTSGTSLDPSSAAASDEVVVNGHRKDIGEDTLVSLRPTYTIPMAPPSSQGLMYSISTLSDSNAVPTRVPSTAKNGMKKSSNDDSSQRSSEQSAGSNTAEDSPRVQAPTQAQQSLERNEMIDDSAKGGEPSLENVRRKDCADEGRKIRPATPKGEETNELGGHKDVSAEKSDGDCAEPIIYLRHSSGLSIVSDMVESTASSWMKQQSNNSSRNTSHSSTTNSPMSIIGEELVIEDGLDPTEALKRASEQLEEQADAIEAEAEARSAEKRSRRNAKDSKRLYDQGLVYYEQKDFEASRSCFASALKMRIQTLGQDNVDVCLTQEKLGDTLVKLDRIEDAHWQYLMAFRGLQHCNLPKDNPHSARILICLGDIFKSANDYARALKYYEKSIRFRSGSKPSSVSIQDIQIGVKKCAVAHEAMAKSEWDKSEIDMCRFHIRELLWVSTYDSPEAMSLFAESKTKKLPIDDERFVINTGIKLVSVSSSSEEDEDPSFSYVEESRALLQRKGSSSSDLDIIRVLDSTAHIHAERGEFANAFKCYMEKLTYLRSKFHNKKRSMAQASYQVGLMCSKMGRHIEAISYFSEALNLHQRSRSKDDTKIAELLKCLGSSYLSVKNPILALVHFKEHQSLCGTGGEKELLSIMGISRAKQYDLPRSLDCYCKVMDMEAQEDNWLARQNPLGPLIETIEQVVASPKAMNVSQTANEKARDCKDLKMILLNLGLAQLIRNPKSTQPSNYVKDLVQYLNEDGCINGVNFTQVLYRMGNILLRRNRYREAIVYYEKCISSLSDEEKEKDANDYVDLLTNLGTACLRNGEHDKSFDYFRSALKEVKRVRGRGGEGSSDSDDLDGLNYFSILLQEAREKAMGRESDETVLSLRHIIALYLCKDGRTDEAIEVLKDVEQRMIKLIGEDHPDIIQLRVDISFAQLLGDNAQMARMFYEKAIGPISSGCIPKYHPFYMQYARLVQVHYPTPVPVVAQQTVKEQPQLKDFVPRVA